MPAHNAMDGKVVVVLRTSSVARAPVYAHLRACGVVLVLVHPCAPAAEFGDVFAHWLCHDTNDVAALATALRAFLRTRALRPDAIVSFDEFAVYTAACLAEAHGLRPTPLPSAALRDTNVKSSFRDFCARHGVDAPAMRVLHRPHFWRSLCATDNNNNGNDKNSNDKNSNDNMRRLEQHVVACLDTLRLPVVLKPSPGAGSLLARRCDTVRDVCAHAMLSWRMLEQHPYARHFHVLLQPHTPHDEDSNVIAGGDRKGSCDGCCCCCCCRSSDDNDNKHDSNNNNNGGDARARFAATSACAHAIELLLEEYVDGQEVDVDCAVEHGRVVFCAISDNAPCRLPYFAEEGGVCPSRLDADAQCVLRDLLARYVAAHGRALHGVLHFEAKYDAARRRAYVIEVNCRLGSAETHTMLHTVYRRLHLGEALVRCALGLSVRAQLARHYPECFVRTRDADSETGEGVYVTRDDNDDNTETTSSDGVPCDVVSPRALGGAACGFFAPAMAAASVNVYPRCAGVLRRVDVPHDEDALVAYSVAAAPGDAVAPPPSSFALLCWMVARGATAASAVAHIRRLTHALVQDIAPAETRTP